MFREMLEVNTGGQKAGKLEMKHLDYKKAKEFTNKIFDASLIPGLENNFQVAKEHIKMGHTKRKDMPVITSRDVIKFQQELKNGNLTGKEVKMSKKKVKIKDLIPIQDQMYFDKSMKGIAKNGTKKTKEFLQNKTYFITSSDHRIIDGHHRYLQGLLLNPEMEVQILSIDLPIKDLLNIGLEFGDSQGNTRNK